MFSSPARATRSIKRPRSVSGSDDPVKYSMTNSSQTIRHSNMHSSPVKAAQVRKLSANTRSKVPSYIGSHAQLPNGTKYQGHKITLTKEINKMHSHDKRSQIKFPLYQKQPEPRRIGGKALNVKDDLSVNLGSTYVVKSEPKGKSGVVGALSDKFRSEDVSSVVKVQALWRGQWVRKYCPKTTRLLQQLCNQRMQKKMNFLSSCVQR